MQQISAVRSQTRKWDMTLRLEVSSATSTTIPHPSRMTSSVRRVHADEVQLDEEGEVHRRGLRLPNQRTQREREPRAVDSTAIRHAMAKVDGVAKDKEVLREEGANGHGRRPNVERCVKGLRRTGEIHSRTAPDDGDHNRMRELRLKTHDLLRALQVATCWLLTPLHRRQPHDLHTRGSAAKGTSKAGPSTDPSLEFSATTLLQKRPSQTAPDPPQREIPWSCARRRRNGRTWWGPCTPGRCVSSPQL